jgi:tRNA(Ile)-lysidine synthase
MIIEEFADFIERKDLVRPGMKLVLAVSGGMDSMVLLDLFLQLRKPWSLGMVIAHVNHQLRGNESNGDEEFVRSYALAHELEFFGKRIETIGLMHSLRLSKQEAARLARYEYFDEVRKHTLSERIATAHHADDNAETILMNVLRGTGIRGLSGIQIGRAHV